MKLRSLWTSAALMVVVATAAMALRAADDKSGQEQPGVIKFTQAPAAVQKAFKDETKNAKIDLLGQAKGEDGKSFFKAIVPVGSQDYEMAISEDGQLLEKMLNPIRAEVKFEECPAIVQKALKDDSKNAKVESIEKITAGKRSDYMMLVATGKTKYLIVFTEDGTMMSKVLDYGNGSDVPSPEAPKVTEKPEKPAAKKAR